MRTPPVQKENPDLKVISTVTEEYGRPSIHLTYSDGEEQTISPAGSTISDLIDQVERVARWKGEGPGDKNPFAALRAEVAASKN